MIVDEDAGSGKDGEAGEDGNGVDEDVIGNAYRESVTSVDGFARGPGGRIKFNKDTKKRRREYNEIDEDVEMADDENISTGRKKSRKKEKNEPKLGHEFKAKVCGSLGFLS